jgi:saccharopine dehydrogenase (NAD+, L-lysine forming)
MVMDLKIGVLKETKNPPDRRVAVTPHVAMYLRQQYPNLQIFIQSSDLRAFKDNEYESKGFILTNDLSHCDVLMGIKEAAISSLIPNKTYVFFSHTAKKQKHNQKLLQEVTKLGITLLDHEYFTDKSNMRLVAFGKWAGIVGSYNGLIAYGKRTGTYELKRANECFDMKEMFGCVSKVSLPNIKILVTGGGRVAHGAMETFRAANLKEVSPEHFLTKEYLEPVFCRIDPWDYTHRKDGKEFDYNHFCKNPAEYETTYKPYQHVTDIYVPCHFWDPASPKFILPEDYLDPNFRIKVIADVSCDLDGPIASTLRASTIALPFYGYDPYSRKEGDPFDKANITVTAIDNLPGELPRDASEDFSMALAKHIFPAYASGDPEGIIDRATIVRKGKLTPKFSYLKDFLEGNE